MSKQSVAQTASGKDNSTSNLVNGHSEGETFENLTSEQEAAESFRTLQLLKEWRVVAVSLKKGQEAYKFVKCSSKITEAGLDVTEKALSSLKAYSADVIQKVKPVLILVDNVASEGVERLQKSLPVVKESPEKIYASAVERLGNVVSPVVNTAVAMTEVGREKAKKIADNIVTSSRGS